MLTAGVIVAVHQSVAEPGLTAGVPVVVHHIPAPVLVAVHQSVAVPGLTAGGAGVPVAVHHVAALVPIAGVPVAVLQSEAAPIPAVTDSVDSAGVNVEVHVAVAARMLAAAVPARYLDE